MLVLAMRSLAMSSPAIYEQLVGQLVGWRASLEGGPKGSWEQAGFRLLLDKTRRWILYHTVVIHGV